MRELYLSPDIDGLRLAPAIPATSLFLLSSRRLLDVPQLLLQKLYLVVVYSLSFIRGRSGSFGVTINCLHRSVLFYGTDIIFYFPSIIFNVPPFLVIIPFEPPNMLEKPLL